MIYITDGVMSTKIFKIVKYVNQRNYSTDDKDSIIFR